MRHRVKISTILIFVMLLTLTGCSLETERELVRLPEDTFQETSFNMVYVQRGDVSYGIEEEMKLLNYVEKEYGFEATRLDAEMQQDIAFDQLFVNVGDTVKKGEELIRLRSDSLDRAIEQYTQQRDMAELNLKHLRNRKEIAPDQDNSGEINSCEQDLKIARGYLAELNEKKRSLSICAEEDGEVISISDKALSGMVNYKDKFLIVASGDDTYYVETTESTTLKEGEIASVSNAVVDYDAKVEKVEKSSAGSKIYFKLINTEKEKTIVRGLKAVVAEEIRENVLFIPEKCVKEKDGRYFAFIKGEHGARVAKEIQIDGVLGGNVIIKEGLDEGDEVISN